MLVAAGSKERQVPLLLKLLLDFGADPNFAPTHVIDGPFLQTPLHIAVESRDLTIVRLLVEGGADRSAKNSNGHPPADLARQSRDETKSAEFVALIRLLEE